MGDTTNTFTCKAVRGVPFPPGPARRFALIPGRARILIEFGLRSDSTANWQVFLYSVNLLTETLGTG
jgi:hypothetical protein